MSLSERVRVNSEAAPWVIEEIKALEAKVYSLENKVTELSWDGALNDAEDKIVNLELQNRKMFEALEEIKASNFPGGAEAVFDIAEDVLNEVKGMRA